MDSTQIVLGLFMFVSLWWGYSSISGKKKEKKEIRFVHPEAPKILRELLLKSRYEAPWWLKGSWGGHLQTFWAFVGRRSPSVPWEHFPLSPGVSVQWWESSSNSPAVFLVPGIAGSAEQQYIKGKDSKRMNKKEPLTRHIQWDGQWLY